MRFFLISSHYRKSINYSIDTITQAKKNYNKIINTIEKINLASIIEKDTTEAKDLISKMNIAESRIIEAMDDDFDTPVALAEMLTLFRETNKALFEENLKINQEFKDKFYDFINFSESIFGIFPFIKSSSKPFSTESANEKDNLIKNLINLIIEIRVKLREKKMYDISDVIRDRLRELGIDLEDKKVQ